MSKAVAAGEGQPEAAAKTGVGRRRVIKTAAGFAVVYAVDSGIGQIQNSFFMTDTPTIHIFPQPDSRATLIAAPGTGNGGYQMGRLLSYALGGRATVISVEYAENNVDPSLITAGVKDALAEVPKTNRQKVGHYWLSTGGVIMAPVAHALGEGVDLAMLDSAPLTKDDLRGSNGVAARIPEFLSRSRLLNLVFSAIKDGSIPPAADDKADWVPIDLATAHREFTVSADIMTSAAEVEALSRYFAPDSFAGFATAAFFMTCPAGADKPEGAQGVDPLVIVETAQPGWNVVFGGNVGLYVDPHRSANSHGVGPIYPGGIMHLVEETLA